LGTAEGERLAEQIVRLATASNGGETRTRTTASFAEYRSRTRAWYESVADSYDATWWRYVTSSRVDRAEFRVMSKATGGAGGFLVLQDMDELITSARRARGVIGAAARELVTTHGRTITAPIAATHGSGTWTAESGSFTPSDETITNASLSAFKATTKLILSEELLEDALEGFDRFLADELGHRVAALEESAFALGDGAGKPQGVAATGNGVATVAAATGSATGFKLADVRTVWAALPEGYKPNASWLMSPSAFASLANLTDTAGALVLPTLHTENRHCTRAPSSSPRSFPPPPQTRAASSWATSRAGYAVRRVRGLGVRRHSELHSDSGHVGLRVYERVDGRVVLADALRILTNSAT
jgi:HK97 family phage major capsid protein